MNKRKDLFMKAFIRWAKRTTKACQLQAKKKWTIKGQWNKIEEEIDEFKVAIKKESNYRIIEEGWDVILSTLTMLHVLNMPNDEIHMIFLRTMKKIDDRIKDGYYGRVDQK